MTERLMRAVEISSFGAPDVLRLGQRPVPQPGVGELLLRVAAEHSAPRAAIRQAC